MIITFRGAANEVGRSCIEINNRFLLDAGLKISEDSGSEYPSYIDLEKIEAVFISHAHLDHTGALPLFNHDGLQCPIFCTKMTKLITKVLLTDSLHIELLETKHPGYGKENIFNVMSFMQNVKFNKHYDFDDIKYRFLPAGHIPGASLILLEIDNHKLLYTGDINHINTKLISGSQSYPNNIDILICESTYGNRDHPDRRAQEKLFVKKVKEGLAKGGSVLLPAFSVGRAQEIALILAEQKLKTNIYIDGMAKKITNLFLMRPEFINQPEKLKKALTKIKFVEGRRHRDEIIREQGVFITTSGMLSGGPVIYYLKHLYHNTNNYLLLTGYQAEGSNGRLLLEQGSAYVDGFKLKWQGYIEKFDFSAHSGKKELIKFIKSIKPKYLILGHGDPDAIKSLKYELKSIVKKIIIPKLDDPIEL